MNDSIQIMSFKKVYPRLDLKLFKDDEERYNLALNEIAIKEFNDGFFKVKRVYKATKKGTSIKFESIKTEEEAKKIREELIAERKRLVDIVLINDYADAVEAWLADKKRETIVADDIQRLLKIGSINENKILERLVERGIIEFDKKTGKYNVV